MRLPYKDMDKKGELNLTSGLLVRIAASLIIALSLPFLVANPLNPLIQAVFAFGNFLMVIGANVK